VGRDPGEELVGGQALSSWHQPERSSRSRHARRTRARTRRCPRLPGWQISAGA
jgi:hypothetical protein